MMELALYILMGASFCFVLIFRVVIVPARKRFIVRNIASQRTRFIPSGLGLVMPYEWQLSLDLPIGLNCIQRVDEFSADAHAYYRYDPAPYHAHTKDQVDAYIDLWIQYTVDVERAVDYPTDVKMLLDDTVRARTQEIVGDMKRTELSALHVATRLNNTVWPPNGNGITIVHVGVQDVAFDAHMQALLRAQSAGVSALEALDYASRADLLGGRQAHVLVNAPTVTRKRSK